MDIPFNILTKSAEETAGLGAELGHSLLEKGSTLPRVLCLWGELGSGKTTFAQGVSKGLGITKRLLSPIFIIVRRYHIPSSQSVLCHVDLYRIQKETDLEGLGLSEMIADPDVFMIIEWPERLGALLPKHRLDIRYEVLPDGRHKIWMT